MLPLLSLVIVSNDFSGAIVISSDKQTAAISNILDSGRNAFASYVGRSSGSTTVSLPLLTNALGGFTTWYSVQNAGSSPATVNVSYSDGLSASETIPVGSAKVFYQAQEGHEDGTAFAATISSDQPVIAAVIQESTSIMFSYTGFTSGTASPVFPLVNQNNGGYRTRPSD